jgi:TonB family protein
VGPFHHLRHHFSHARHHDHHVEVVRVEAPAMHVPPPPEVIVAPPLVRTLELSDVDVPPELLNEAEVMRLMQRAYPPLMRDAHVEGQAMVRFRVLPDGRVDAGSVSVEQATHDAFGIAAIRVAERMRFRPAQLDGDAVSAWVTLPLSFHPASESVVEVF